MTIPPVNRPFSLRPMSHAMRNALVYRTGVRFIVLTALSLGVLFPSPAPAQNQPVIDGAFFDKQVLPILQTHCFKCHGAEAKIKGGLRLTSRENILKGGDSGPAVVLDKPETSRFLQAIRYQDGLEMPPKVSWPTKTRPC